MALSIEDRLAIQDLYSDYCHTIDDGRGKAFAACFTADGTLEVGGMREPLAGVDALTAFGDATAQARPGLRHVVTNLLVDGDGDSATGRAYLYAYATAADGHQVLMTGRYQDTLRKVDGSWRFASRTMVADTPS